MIRMKNFAVKELVFFLLILSIVLISFYLFNVLLPFFLGLFIAYLLDPLVDWLENKNILRGIGATIVLLVFFFFIFLLTFLIIPILFAQTVSFINDFPDIINKLNNLINFFLEYLKKKLIFFPVSELTSNISPSITKATIAVLKNFASSSMAVFNIITLLLITPIVSWYFLRDWDKMSNSILDLVSKKYKSTVVDYLKKIDLILSSYLRGQLLVSLFLSLFYCLCFTYMELNYSFFIAIFSGFFSFIPVIGIILSYIVASILTYLQFVDFSYLIYIAVIFLTAQLLESNLLTPKLIGNKLGLHPLVVIFSIFVFGALFGIVGVIFSIPLTSILVMLFKKKFFNEE